MQYIALGNPLWSGHVALYGGWRKMFWSTSAYALIMIVGCAIAVKTDEFRNPGEGAAWALAILPYIQLGILFAVGASARFKAMIRDHQTRMVESIRMSPVRAFTVVAGYMFGPIGPTMLSWLVGVFVGVALNMLYGLGGEAGWVAGNALMLVSAMTAWALQVFLGVGFRKPNNMLNGLYIGCFMLSLSGQPIVFIPGLSIFLGFQPAMASMAVMDGALSFDRGLAIGMFASLTMTVFWWWAAARRFRRPDLPALSVRGAMLLCVLWAACAAVSCIQVKEIFVGSMFNRGEHLPILAMVLCGTMLIFMAFPISSASQVLRLQILQRREPSSWLERWTFPVLLAALAISMASLWSVMCKNAFYERRFDENVLYDPQFVDSALIMMATGLMLFGVFRISCIRKGTTVPGWTQMIAFWVLPVIFAWVWHSFQIAREVRAEGDSFGILFSVSPIGGLIATWTSVNAPVRMGITVQFALAFVVLLLGFLVERSFRRVRAERLVDCAYSVPSNSGEET